jgi:hypothetical protein
MGGSGFCQLFWEFSSKFNQNISVIIHMKKVIIAPEAVLFLAALE